MNSKPMEKYSLRYKSGSIVSVFESTDRMRIWTAKSKDRTLGHCIREESKKGEDAGEKNTKERAEMSKKTRRRPGE